LDRPTNNHSNELPTETVLAAKASFFSAKALSAVVSSSFSETS
jgi:hypothetical protein